MLCGVCVSRSKSRYILGNPEVHEAFEQQLYEQYRRCTLQEMARRRDEAQAKPIRSCEYSIELLTNMPPWLAPVLHALPVDAQPAQEESDAESLISAVWLMSLQAHRAAKVSLSADDLLPLLAGEVDKWFAPLLREMNPQELDQFVEAVLMASIQASDRTGQEVVWETRAERQQRYDNSYGLVSCYTMFVNQMQRCLPAQYRHMAQMLRDKFNAKLSEYDIKLRIAGMRADIDRYKQILVASVENIEAMKGQETKLNKKHDDAQASVASFNRKMANTDRERSKIPVWLDPVAIVHKIFDLQKRQSVALSSRLQQQIEVHSANFEKQKEIHANISRQMARCELALLRDQGRLDVVAAEVSAANLRIQREVAEWQSRQPVQVPDQLVKSANSLGQVLSSVLVLGDGGLQWMKQLGTLAVGVKNMAVGAEGGVEMANMGVSRPVSPSDVEFTFVDEKLVEQVSPPELKAISY